MRQRHISHDKSFIMKFHNEWTITIDVEILYKKWKNWQFKDSPG